MRPSTVSSLLVPRRREKKNGELLTQIRTLEETKQKAQLELKATEEQLALKIQQAESEYGFATIPPHDRGISKAQSLDEEKKMLEQRLADAEKKAREE